MVYDTVQNGLLIEANLNSKNYVINDLIEKLKNKECCMENDLSQNETTFFNPSAALQHCDKCSFETYQEGELERHVKSTHTTSFSNFKCDLCDFISKTTGGLKTHVTKMHTKSRRVKCWTCDYTCETKGELVIHNDKYWYSHRMCLNKNHKKDILEEFEQLKSDGFKVHQVVLDTHWLKA